MLVANETVAQHLDDQHTPTLYRVHEDPDPIKVVQFEEFISTLGYSLNRAAEDVKPRDFQKLVERMTSRIRALDCSARISSAMNAGRKKRALSCAARRSST